MDFKSTNFVFFKKHSDLHQSVMFRINPFVPNTPFLYPLKTCFQGVEKGRIGDEYNMLTQNYFFC